MLSFTNLKRHMKTVHNEDTGKRWICNSCGKASQSEKRLILHETLHRSGDFDDQKIYSCNDCDYRTIVERYLVDHKKTQHTSSGNGQFICARLMSSQVFEILTFANEFLYCCIK